MTDRSKTADRAYWALVGAFCVFGFISAASIGLPFLIIGGTLGALSDHRDRPRVFWPVLALVVGFFVGFVLFGPFSCTDVVVADGKAVNDTGVVCRGLIGPSYAGDDHNPSLLPGILGGFGVALVVGATARLAISFLEKTLTS